MTDKQKFKKGDEVKFSNMGTMLSGIYQQRIQPAGTGRGHFVRALVTVDGRKYRPALSSLAAK